MSDFLQIRGGDDMSNAEEQEYQTLSDELKTMRSSHELMQTQLAFLIGTNQNQISVWERADDGHRELRRLELAMPRIRDVMSRLDELPKEVPHDYAERIRGFRQSLDLERLEFKDVLNRSPGGLIDEIDYKTLLDWESGIPERAPESTTWLRLLPEFVRLTPLPRDYNVEKVLKPDTRVEEQHRARLSNPVPRDYPERIKNCRKAMGMKQAEFAGIVGANGQAMISSWELGKTEPSLQQWARLEELERSAPSQPTQGELFDSTEEPTGATEEPTGATEEAQEELVLDAFEQGLEQEYQQKYEEAIRWRLGCQSAAVLPPAQAQTLRDMLSRLRLELRRLLKDEKPEEYHRLSDMIAGMEEEIL